MAQQPGWNARQAGQAAIRAQQVAEQGRQLRKRAERQRRKKEQRRAAAPATPAVPAAPQAPAPRVQATPFALERGTAPAASGRQLRGKIAALAIALLALVWAAVIMTRIEWIRLHDGPIRPFPYDIAAVISVLSAALSLVSFLTRIRKPALDGLGQRDTEADSDRRAPAAASLAPPVTRPAARRIDPAETAPIPAAQSDGGAPDRGPGAGRPAKELEVTAGPAAGSRIVLAGERRLGRDEPGGDLNGDPTLSRHHAVLRDGPGGLTTIEDLGSSNGTFVNTGRVSGIQPLRVGDVVKVGGSTLRLIGPPLASEPPTLPSPAIPVAGVEDGEPVRSAGELLADGRALYEQERYEQSRYLFLKAADFPRARADANYGLGMIGLSQGNLTQAKIYFTEAVNADSRHANALYQLGVLSSRDNNPAEAHVFYMRAIDAEPQHAAAHAMLKKLDEAQGLPSRLPEESVSQPSVYAYLLADPAPISRQAVDLIRRVESDVRPRFAAYFGRYFSHVLAATGTLAVTYAVLAAARAHVSSGFLKSGMVSALLALALALVFIFPILTLIIGYASARCTRIRFRQGRLQIEKGIFGRHVNNIDLWRVSNIDLDRRFINRLTGDGILVFSLTFDVLAEEHPQWRRRNKAAPRRFQEVIGVARDDRLRELHQELLNLCFLLRGNPVVKGIIQ